MYIGKSQAMLKTFLDLLPVCWEHGTWSLQRYRISKLCRADNHFVFPVLHVSVFQNARWQLKVYVIKIFFFADSFTDVWQIDTVYPRCTLRMLLVNVFGWTAQIVNSLLITSWRRSAQRSHQAACYNLNLENLINLPLQVSEHVYILSWNKFNNNKMRHGFLLRNTQCRVQFWGTFLWSAKGSWSEHLNCFDTGRTRTRKWKEECTPNEMYKDKADHHAQDQCTHFE